MYSIHPRPAQPPVVEGDRQAVWSVVADKAAPPHCLYHLTLTSLVVRISPARLTALHRGVVGDDTSNYAAEAKPGRVYQA